MAVEVSLTNNNSITNITTNMGRIETALADGLSRTGATPNAMEVDLDMDDNTIINVSDISMTGGTTLSSYVTSATTAATQAVASAASAASDALILANAFKGASTALTYTVGTGGDFSTVNEALAAASIYNALYEKEGIQIEVRMLAGFEFVEQVFVFQKDLGYVIITSEDWDNSGTPVTIRRSAMTDVVTKTNWRTGVFPAFTAMSNAVLPVIACKFAFDSTGDGIGSVGILVKENSLGLILRTCGITGAGWRGLYADNGAVYARESDFSNSGLLGGPARGAAYRISNSSYANIRDSVGTGSGTGLYANSCLVSAQSCDFSGAVEVTGLSSGSAPGDGIYCSGKAEVFANNVDVSGADGSGVVTENGAQVHCDGVDASDVTGSAIKSQEGGYIYAASGTITNAGDRGLDAISGGRIIARGATISVAATGTRTVSLSGGTCEVDASDCTITGGGSSSIQLFGGSQLNLSDSAVGDEISYADGSMVNISGATDLAGTGLPSVDGPIGVWTEDGLVYGLIQHIGSDNGDATVTISSSAEEIQVTDTVLTASRGLVLPNVVGKRKFRLIRSTSSTDNNANHRNLNIQYPSGTTLWTLHTGDYIDIVSDGTNYKLVGYGNLDFTKKLTSADNGDAGVSHTSNTEQVIYYDTALTGDRNVNLPDADYGKMLFVYRSASATGDYSLILLDDVTNIGELHEADTFCILVPNNALDGWMVLSKGVGSTLREKVSTDQGDVSTTLPNDCDTIMYFDTALTANRGIRMPDPDKRDRPVRLIRTANATGAFELRGQQHDGTLIKVVGIGEWAEFHPNNDLSSWVLTGFGSL